jgi:hypothetical protein
MRRRQGWVGRLVAGVVVVVAVGVVAGPAVADPYGSGGGSVSVPDPAPGSSVTVSGSGFQPDSLVTVQILSTPVFLATVRADANGVATAQVRIPAGFAAGTSHHLQLVGVGSSGAAHTVSVPVTLVPAGTGLPGTGRSWTALGLGVAAVALGVAAVVLGVVLLLIRRRRGHGAAVIWGGGR